MLQLIPDGVNFLAAEGWANALSLFLIVVTFDIPRYFMGFLAVAVLSVWKVSKPPANGNAGFVSVVIPGHNEEDRIVRCVLSLWEQSGRRMRLLWSATDRRIACRTDCATCKSAASSKPLTARSCGEEVRRREILRSAKRRET